MSNDRIAFIAPIAFWEDHINRSDNPDALRDAEVERLKAGMAVLLTAEQLSELKSDAKFYADMGVAEFGWEYAGVVSSARATVKRIAKLQQAEKPKERMVTWHEAMDFATAVAAASGWPTEDDENDGWD